MKIVLLRSGPGREVFGLLQLLAKQRGNMTLKELAKK